MEYYLTVTLISPTFSSLEIVASQTGWALGTTVQDAYLFPSASLCLAGFMEHEPLLDNYSIILSPVTMAMFWRILLVWSWTIKMREKNICCGVVEMLISVIFVEFLWNTEDWHIGQKRKSNISHTNQPLKHAFKNEYQECGKIAKYQTTDILLCCVFKKYFYEEWSLCTMVIGYLIKVGID